LTLQGHPRKCHFTESSLALKARGSKSWSTESRPRFEFSFFCHSCGSRNPEPNPGKNLLDTRFREYDKTRVGSCSLCSHFAIFRFA
jgi:hypothetical protein